MPDTLGNHASHDEREGERSVDEITEEFLARLRQGENPSVVEYTRMFPYCADELEDLLPALAAMEQLGRKEKADRQMARLAGAAEGTIEERLGDYRIIREIGRGGMGVVYEAEQETLGRHVALKVMSADLAASAQDRERFRLEAEAAAKLYHSNIVPVFGVGQEGQLPYYVMQYIDGIGLDAVLAEARKAGNGGKEGSSIDKTQTAVWELLGASSETAAENRRRWIRIARLGRDAALALAHAHQHGVVHRDIKPSNLLFDREGRVWITDFGLARYDGGDRVTLPGSLVGTFRYMAPEQFEGKADARSDVHSLGLTLFELLTLKSPFPEGDHAKLVLLKTSTEVPSPRKLNHAIPRDLGSVVRKACALRPGHRYDTAMALAADLELFLAGRPIRARHVTPAERLWRWSIRNRLVASLAAVAILLLVNTAIIATVGYVRTSTALGEAAASRKEAEGEWQRAETNLRLAFAAFDEIIANLSSRGLSTSLEHDLLEGVLNAGSPSPADAELLGTLVSFFDDFSKHNEHDTRIETASVFKRIGDIRQRLGDIAEAEEAYGKALAVYAKLPDDALPERGLILAKVDVLNQLGIVASRHGDTRGAVEMHESALAILEGDGVKADSAPVRFFKARTLNLLGSIALRTGEGGLMGAMRGRRRPSADARDAGRDRSRQYQADAQSAADGNREALTILEELCREAPENADFRHELANCLRNRIALACREGDMQLAREAREIAIVSFGGLARDFPDVAGYQYELAATLCIQLPGRRGAAPILPERASQAVEISQNLKAIYPWNPGYRALWAAALMRQAEVEHDAGMLSDAEKNYALAANELGKLTERPEVSLGDKIAHAKALHALGDTLRDRGKLSESLNVLEQAQAIVQDQTLFRNPPHIGLAGRIQKSISETLAKQGL